MCDRSMLFLPWLSACLAVSATSALPDDGSLPDFSHAGYREGEPLPDDFRDLKRIDVTDFGAVPDDGRDDTDAFRQALETGGETLITIPAGTFEVRDRITITSSRTILRGAGSGETVLRIPVGLEEIDPSPTETSGGRPTSRYSWSGGFLRIQGDLHPGHPAQVRSRTERGDDRLDIGAAAANFSPGDRCVVTQRLTSDGGLLRHLYSGDPGDTSRFNDSTFRFVTRVAEVLDGAVRLDRPLRCAVDPDWEARLSTLDPTVRFSGIERLTIAFPAHRYEGHFTEAGYNGIELDDAVDCWVRDVAIHNADSGIYLGGVNCTLRGITLAAPDVEPARHHGEPVTGHHGLELGVDCLVRDFRVRTVFIHDITASARATGNVVMAGGGRNLSLDHHRRAPYANLYTDLDLGDGARFLVSGGGRALGRHAGGWNVFWNLRSRNPVHVPPGFGPATLVFAGADIANADALRERGMRVEEDTAARANLYLDQRARRERSE